MWLSCDDAAVGEEARKPSRTSWFHWVPSHQAWASAEVSVSMPNTSRRFAAQDATVTPPLHPAGTSVTQPALHWPPRCQRCTSTGFVGALTDPGATVELVQNTSR